jgi:hypothetical protein
MKWTSVPLTALLAATVGMGVGGAQQPPPPPRGGPPALPIAAPLDPNAPPPPGAPPGVTASQAYAGYSRKGTIKAFNAGPNGETNGIILGDGTAVLFPAEMGEQFRTTVREGSHITVTGMSRSEVSGRMVVNAQTITANGQTFTVPVGPPVLPGGPGAQAGSGPPPPPSQDGPPPAGGRGGRGPRPGPPPAAAGPQPPPPPPGRAPGPPDAL